MKIFALALGGLFVIGLTAWAYVSGQHVPFNNQWPLYEALRTTASIIFAVVGAWLAIIYPERLKFAFRGGEQLNHSAQPSSMGRLLSPAIHSTAILCVILLVGVIAPLLSNVPQLLHWRGELRGASYVVLVLLTLWQLGTIILTLVPADQIKHESDKEELRQRTIHEYFKDTQRLDADQQNRIV